MKRAAQFAIGATLALAAPLALAQTTTTPTTPGVPDTGVGGEQALTIGVLAVSGLVALGGAAYLMRRPA